MDFSVPKIKVDPNGKPLLPHVRIKTPQGRLVVHSHWLNIEASIDRWKAAGSPVEAQFRPTFGYDRAA